RSSSIGVVVPDLTNPFFPPIVRGIEAAFAPHGYVLLIVNTDNSAAQESQLVASLQARSIDGLILATARLDHPLIGTLAAGDPPPRGAGAALRDARRRGRHPARGRPPGPARPPAHRAHRRAAGHLHRDGPAASLPGRGAGARAGLRPGARRGVRLVVGGGG